MSNFKDQQPSHVKSDATDSATGNSTKVNDPEHYKVSNTVSNSSPEQTAAYLADMLQELQTMASKAGHSSLGEMLEFAHREAIWRSRTNDDQHNQSEGHT